MLFQIDCSFLTYLRKKYNTHTIDFRMLDMWQPPWYDATAFVYLVIRFLLSSCSECSFLGIEIHLIRKSQFAARGYIGRQCRWELKYNWNCTLYIVHVNKQLTTRNFEHMFRFSCIYYYYYLIICRFMSGSTVKLFVYYFGFVTSNEPKYLETTFSVFCVKYRSIVVHSKSLFGGSNSYIWIWIIHFEPSKMCFPLRRIGCRDIFRHIYIYISLLEVSEGN